MSDLEKWIGKQIERTNPFLLKIPQLAITATSFSALILVLMLNPAEAVLLLPFILFIGFYWLKIVIQKGNN